MRKTKYKMSLREAIEVLIDHTERDLIGAGCGMRAQPTYEQREKARMAIDRAQLFLWRARSSRH